MHTDDTPATPTDPARALKRLREALCDQASALRSSLNWEIEDRGAGHQILHLRNQERACLIDNPEDGVHATFLWDNRPLFAGRFEDAGALSRLITRWVADRAMPSVMGREFPGLEMDELADFYERGVPLEGEFIRSWDAMEEFYHEDSGDYFAAVRALIKAMRAAGYDRQLRAGQSMSILGLSRSGEQGLRDGQPRLWFEFGADDMDVDANFAPGSLKRHPIRLTPEVRHLLDTLANQPIT